FFFSSRRRHTRCLSDWSSDVCSSDLDDAGGVQHAALLAVIDQELHLRRAELQLSRVAIEVEDPRVGVEVVDLLLARKCFELTLRSEEHTSELQSLRHLVCRLLLEKKK